MPYIADDDEFYTREPESFEATLTVNMSVNEDDSMAARHEVARQLRRIAQSIEDGMRTEGRVMHTNGHEIGSYALMQTNLPED